MPSLGERLQAALNEARKSRDQARTLLFSTILADLKNREIQLRHTPTDEEAVEVVRRGVKQRREAVEAYEAAGRPAIAAGAKDLGKVMGQVMPHLKGRADGKVINQIAREELSTAV